MNLLVISIASTIAATLLLIGIAFFFIKFLMEQWELKAKIRRQHMAGKYPDREIKHLPIMKTEIEKPESICIMNHQLEDARTLRLELRSREEQARGLKQWLIDNPTAPEQDIKAAKKLLLLDLQDINDLVCKLKPRPVITVK